MEVGLIATTEPSNLCSSLDSSAASVNVASIRSEAIEQASSSQVVVCCKEEVEFPSDCQDLQVSNVATDWCKAGEIQPIGMVRTFETWII